jgi:hypothetical protein
MSAIPVFNTAGLNPATEADRPYLLDDGRPNAIKAAFFSRSLTAATSASTSTRCAAASICSY